MTHEFTEMAQMTINQMQQDDGVIESFLNGTEEVRVSLAIEYMQIAVQKNAKMAQELISYPWKLEAFASVIGSSFTFKAAA